MIWVGVQYLSLPFRFMRVQAFALWTKSFPGGKSQEHGGTIVEGSTGKEYLINEGGGTSGSFSPNLKTPSSRFSVIGVFHTHPYDSTEGGHTGVSLSGGDAAYLILKGHKIIIAQSGSQQFMFMRTQNTSTSVNYSALDNSNNLRIGQLTASGMKYNAASQQAAKEMANKHGLAYYEGTNGVFKKVN